MPRKTPGGGQDASETRGASMRPRPDAAENVLDTSGHDNPTVMLQ